jgi:inositol monophosphatase 3
MQWPRPPRRRRTTAFLLSLLLALLLATAMTTLHLARAATPPPVHRVSAHVLFEALLRAVVAGGGAVFAARSGGSTGATSTAYPDGSRELHTAADAASSAALSAALSTPFPALAVVDEERVARGGAAGWRPTRRSLASVGGGGGGGGGAPPPRHPMLPFPELSAWVDPLDATQEFSEGQTEFVTVSACITRCGVPIAGAVYAPFSGRLYWARPGSGVQVSFSVDAALDAERALAHGWGDAGAGAGGCCAAPRAAGGRAFAGGGNASAAPAAPGGGGLRVVVSRSHGGGAGGAAVAAALAAAEAAAGAPPPTLTPAGGAGYKLLRLLEGDADVYVHGGALRKWDLCGGDALLREAGGGVGDLSGAAVDYCLPPLPGPPPPRLAAAGGGGGGGGGGGDAAAAAAGEAARAAAVATAVAVRGVVAAADPGVGARVLRAVEGVSL